jgi:hypothetical protein
MSKNSCTFLASFPPIQSAIKTSGGGDGMRIQLDIPESQMGNALELLTMRSKILKVTIEVSDKQRVTGNDKIQTRTEW